MSNIKKNVFYQTLYNLVATLTPLLTTPYVARVLGTSGAGRFSYTLSIVSYFVSFSMLGIVNYGCKEISKCFDDKILRSKRFFEIYIIQFAFSLFSFFAYFIYLYWFESEHLGLFFVQSIRIISCAMDLSWVLFGLEEFEITVKRDLFIKILTIVLIFSVVRGSNATIIYTFIMAITTLLSKIIVFPYVRTVIVFCKPDLKKALENLKPIFLFFIPTISAGLFHEVDITVLGKYGLIEESGCYYNADRIINIPKGIIIGLGTVFLTRLSKLFSENNIEKTKAMYQKSLELYTFMVCPISIGIAAIADDFIPLFLGRGFEGSIPLISWLGIVLVIRTYNNHMLTAYYLPCGQEMDYTKVTTFTTILNIVLDIFLIRKYGALGAVWVTIICEGIVFVYLWYSADKGIVKMKKTAFICNIMYYICGIGMFISVIAVKRLFNIQGLGKVFIEIMSGALTYSLLCIIFWTSTKYSFLGDEFRYAIQNIDKTFKGRLR